VRLFINGRLLFSLAFQFFIVVCCAEDSHKPKIVVHTKPAIYFEINDHVFHLREKNLSAIDALCGNSQTTKFNGEARHFYKEAGLAVYTNAEGETNMVEVALNEPPVEQYRNYRTNDWRIFAHATLDGRCDSSANIDAVRRLYGEPLEDFSPELLNYRIGDRLLRLWFDAKSSKLAVIEIMTTQSSR